MNSIFSRFSCAVVIGLSGGFAVVSDSHAATLSGDINVDNSHTTYISTDDSVAGTQIATGNNWPVTNSFSGVDLEAGRPYYLHVNGVDAGGVAAFLGDFTLTGGGHSFAGGGTTVTTGTNWLVSTTGWSGYVAATGYGTNGVAPWGLRPAPADPSAVWIWSANNNADNDVYFSMAILPTPTDLAVIKTLDTAGPFYIGGSVQFTVTVSNSGPATAADIEITNLPDNLTITGVSSANCSAFPCLLAAMASGASEVITVTATIDSAGDFNITPGVASITGDPDPANNTDASASGGSAVAAPPAPPAPPVQVPTTPQWALILLALLTLLVVLVHGVPGVRGPGRPAN
ncbi:MAG: DUF11 domain-containing protein [Halieaceae bacterium]|jgi:uncharacterized repeat protein (TIGR01451 family)|nr:DUF11 domain-containing protein [Halieaceae bacterium]